MCVIVHYLSDEIVSAAGVASHEINEELYVSYCQRNNLIFKIILFIFALYLLW